MPSIDRKVSAYSFYIIVLLGSYLLKAISNFSNRATRFKGYRQQDSQELLRYLLDSVRNEELRVNLQVFFLIGWSNFISDNVTEIRELCAFSVEERKVNKSSSWYICVLFINVFSESNLLCCTRSVLKVMVMRRPWTTANVYKLKVNISLLYLCTIIVLLRCHFSKKSLENLQNMPRYFCRTGQKYWVTKWLQWTILHFFGLDF